MPQHAKRIKIRRKDLRHPDEFETLTGRVVDLASEYRRPLAVGLAAVLVIGLGVLAVSSLRSSRERAAAGEFERAREVFAAARYGEAVKAFETVAQDYPSTPTGRLARLYRAHALARQDDTAGAMTAYAEYLATSPSSDLLRQDALTNLGRTREVAGDAAGALDAYGQASTIAGPYRRDALLGAARLHEAAGRIAEARAIYAGLMKDDPDPDLRSFLASKLPPGSEPAAAAQPAAQ